MSFSLKIPTSFLPKNTKFKENEHVEWGKKNLTERSEQELTINLVEELSIPPKDIFKHLRVSLGEMVEEGKTLAEKKGFLKKKKFKAPEKAEVRGIDHVSGTITLMIERTVDVPFTLDAVYQKKEDNDFVFKAKEGLEARVTAALERNFGGSCSYINRPEEITLDNCEDKIVVADLDDIMDQAKVYALGPYAVVSHRVSYKALDMPLILVENRDDWKNLFAKKYPFSLYLMGKPTIYFYQP